MLAVQKYEINTEQRCVHDVLLAALDIHVISCTNSELVVVALRCENFKNVQAKFKPVQRSSNM